MQREPERHSHLARHLGGALAVLALLGGVTFWGGQRGASQLKASAWDPAQKADLSVVVRGRELVPLMPMTQAAKLPAEDMLEVGEQGGVALWAQRATAGGGGGGTEQGGLPGPVTGPDGLTVAPADRIERGAWGQLYVRTTDGTFVPLVDRPRLPLPLRRPDRLEAP